MSKTDPETGLQPQQRLFADEFLVDFNGTGAYKRAGYKATGNAAYVGASKLLANPKVQAYLAKRRKEITDKLGSDQEKALQNIIDMSMGDIRSLVTPDGRLKPLHELTRAEAILIQGFEAEDMFEWVGTGDERVREQVGIRYKYKLVNMLDARKLLGVHHGLFAKKVEHSGPGGGPIQSQTQVVKDLLELAEGADTGPGPAASRR
ncbi:MAG TPA: terminase small subunit [Pseudoxanthomonas sp.]